MPWRMLKMDEHFELVKANFIRCEECNENFFFDFLRHPRYAVVVVFLYFVTHFKSCHLKNLLYRFNGYSEEENSRVRFGPRRKKDANSWFGQLKSTEKRMISMQDNKWSEISERECWSCRLCNDGKADLTQVFGLSELGRGQAFLHLRQVHERAYEEFLRKLPDVQNAALMHVRAGDLLQLGGLHGHQQHQRHNPLPPHPARSRTALVPPGSRLAPVLPLGQGTHTQDEQLYEYSQQQQQEVAETSSDRLHNGESVLPLDSSSRRTTLQQRMAEAERSRLRRMKATAEERHVEALRSKKRRENLTPVQRQADYDRRKRKKKRQEESERSRKRREQASEEMRQKEVLRSRERRRNATEDQRRREAMRSKRRRELASDEQKRKERERCRKRYELKKTQRGGGGKGDTGAEARAGNHSSCSSHCSGHRSDDDSQSSTSEYRYREQQYQQDAAGTYEQQLTADIASRPHDNRRPPASSTITSVPPFHISSSTGNLHAPMESVIRGMPLPPHPLPPPPAPSDEVRASFSELTGFRGLLSSSPSATAPFGAARGGSRGGNGSRHGIHSFAPAQGLAMYPPSSYHHRHFPPSQLLRSTVGGSTSKTSASDISVPLEGGGSHMYATPLPPPPLQPASSSSPFAMPQLPASLHALSQSLQPLTASNNTPMIRKRAGGTSPSPPPASAGATPGAFSSSSDRGQSQSGMAVALDMIGSHLQQQQHRQHASEKRAPASSSPGSGSLAFV